MPHPRRMTTHPSFSYLFNKEYTMPNSTETNFNLIDIAGEVIIGNLLERDEELNMAPSSA